MPRPKRTKITTASKPAAPATSVAPTPSRPTGNGTSSALATPSFASIANFKRRPRQPSILRMVQQAAGRATDTEDFDSFATARGRDRPIRARNSDGEEDDDEDLSLSLPPSSPPVSETKPREQRQQLQRESHGNTPPASSSSRKRKRGSDGDSVINVASIKTQHGTDQTSRRKAKTTSSPISISSPRSSSPPLPSVEPAPQPSRRKRAATGKTQKQTQNTQTLTTAELQALLMPKRRMTRRRQRRTDEFEILDSSSEHDDDSDNENLNKRDRRHTSVRQQDGGGDADSDADELELPARKGKFVKKRRPAITPPKLKSGKTQAKPTNASTTKSTLRKPLSVRKDMATTSRNTRTPHAQSKPASLKKTYTRLSSGHGTDKENWSAGRDVDDIDDDEEDTTLSMGGMGEKGKGKIGGKVKSDELAAARKKFEDVDQWDLSFESADIGAGGSSSPWR